VNLVALAWAMPVSGNGRPSTTARVLPGAHEAVLARVGGRPCRRVAALLDPVGLADGGRNQFCSSRLG
jgi:hypothetical protein